MAAAAEARREAPAPPRISVTRRVRFAAARQVQSAALDAAANRSLFGRDVDLHGHDFVLFVTLGGEAGEESGMVMDLKALSRLIRAEVVEPLEHARLDQAALLGGLPASGENLAVAVWRRLERVLPAGALGEVEIQEGPWKSVRYRGE